MAQPPRQPPRQQPKATAARRATPRGAPKGAKPNPKSAAKAATTAKQQKAATRATQHSREAQRAQQQRAAQQRQATKGRRTGSPRAGNTGKPLRGWRSWWSTHEMARRESHDDDMNGEVISSVGGGFSSFRDWSTTRAVVVLTLLVLAAFTGSIALGAKSVAAAVVAFIFFGAALAVATAARAAQHFRRRPVITEPPIDTVTDFRIDDLTIDEDPPDPSDVNSLADLERSFDHDSSHDNDPEPATPPHITPAGTTTSQRSDEKSTDEPSEPATDASSGTAFAMPAQPIAPSTETDSASSATGTAGSSASTVDTPSVTEPSDGAEMQSSPPAQQAPAAAAPDDGTDEPVEAPQSASDEQAEHGAGSDTQANGDADPTEPAAALSLLAAETAGQDLLAAYAASEAHLPPEAVRDVAATLIVSDLDRSLMFYTELLGLVEIDRARDAVLLEAGFGRVLLWMRDDAPGAGDPVMHLTFEVGDIHTAYRTLRDKGVVFTHAPVSALSGEVHDLRAASFLDPDGHGLAITELRER